MAAAELQRQGGVRAASSAPAVCIPRFSARWRGHDRCMNSCSRSGSGGNRGLASVRRQRLRLRAVRLFPLLRDARKPASAALQQRGALPNQVRRRLGNAWCREAAHHGRERRRTCGAHGRCRACSRRRIALNSGASQDASRRWCCQSSPYRGRLRKRRATSKTPTARQRLRLWLRRKRRSRFDWSSRDKLAAFGRGRHHRLSGGVPWQRSSCQQAAAQAATADAKREASVQAAASSTLCGRNVLT